MPEGLVLTVEPFFGVGNGGAETPQVPTVVQARGLAGGSSALARTLSFLQTPTPGNSVVVVASVYSGAGDVPAFFTVSDNQTGNSYKPRVATEAGQGVAAWMAKNVAATGTFTVSVLPNASNYVSLAILEISGLADLSVVGSGIRAVPSGTLTSFTVTVETEVDGCLILGGCSWGGGPITVQAPAISVVEPDEGNGANVSLAVARKEATTKGAHSITWNKDTGSTTVWRAFALALRGVAA